MPRFVFISDAYRKRFGSRTVLDHVSFSVHECEVLGLIGPKMPEKQRSLNALPDSHAKYGERRFRDRPVPSSRRKEALFYLPDAIRPWLRHRRRRACESADRPPALQQTNRRDTRQTVLGDTTIPNPTFGQLVAVGTATNAIPAFANADPPRIFQLPVRFVF